MKIAKHRLAHLRAWSSATIFVWVISLALASHAGTNVARAGESPLGKGTPTAIQANELGRILILEYHDVAPEESRWARSIANFQADLEQLYSEGYRPISMGEYIDGKIGLEAGLKPVLLTFDDSTPGQFRYLASGGKIQIDPQCAVGMLADFHKRHPDFPLKGIFFVLPEAKQPHKLFGQPEHESEKLNQLVKLGFEIGNHTLWHADLKKYDGEAVQKQLALAVEAIQKRVPGYAVRALSLPMGDYPQEAELAVQGSFHSATYRNEAIFKVAGGAARSPFDAACDFKQLPRIQVTANELKFWLRYFREHPGEAYTSDGDPTRVTFPRQLQSKFSASRYKALQANPY